MNLSAPFIYRPIATTLLAIGVAIAGIVAFNLLPVASLPQVEFPTIRVQASLPGASPENMATAIATPLERQLGRIAGITEMTSSSNLGSTSITIQFDLDRNIDGAARDVQAAINAARSQLPANLPSNPSYRKVNPADAPIMIISLTSPTYSTGEIYDIASTVLQQKLSQVEGVGLVRVGGSSLPAVRVELNPTVLNKYGISTTDLAKTIAASNANRPKGQLNNGISTSEIITNDQIFRAYQYRPLIISYQNGKAVKLSDVAEVKDSVEDLRNAGLLNGQPAVALIIFKQPGANVIKTVDLIRQMLPSFKAAVPAAIHMNVTLDRTITIRSSLEDIEATLIIAMLLVILVVYIFLQSTRSMLIPGVAVPLSLLGTFGIMYLLGYSLNSLSLMALTISTGFVVDDAVVVLENITRHIEMGAKPLQAALKGAQEVNFTVISMSFSLIAVFIPILFMGGIVGRLFREFAVTLSVAILVSLVVSLTVTPMMSALLIKPHKNIHKESFLSHRIHLYYEESLRWVLGHQKLMLIVVFMTILLNIFLFIMVPKGFFPQQDTGRITATIQAQQDISFQAMKIKLGEFIKIIKADPAIQYVFGFIGNGTTNSGSLFITLKPYGERKVSADKVIARLRPKLTAVTGAVLYMQSAQDLLIGGRQGNAQFQYTLFADDLNELNLWVPKVMAQLIKLPGIADVNSDQRDQGLQLFVKVDQATAARFGITPQQIDRTLYNAFGQSQVSTMYTARNQYHVIMEVAPAYWQRPEILNEIYVTTPKKQQVPLSTFASFNPSWTLLSVNHQGQSPSATLSFNLLPNEPLGDAVHRVSQTIADMHLPINIQGTFRGTAQAFKESLASEPYLIMVAFIVVYIVLGILYESLIHPITILSTLPSAGVGAILALLFTGTDLSIIALIGVILLIGIVKKNAIMMIDVALHLERNENSPPEDAIFRAALLRFRPIMMTTMAELLGALPLAIGFGFGSEFQRPLGIAIIGGLIVSQMLTLYTTPVIYLSFEKFGQKLKKRWTKLNA
jgi:multidrug efflux pump